MKVAVIGSSGQLGQDLMRLFGEEAVGFAHEDLDVTDDESVASAIGSLKPDWVLNTAAFHRVDDCEVDLTRTFAVNGNLPAVYATPACFSSSSVLPTEATSGNV